MRCTSPLQESDAADELGEDGEACGFLAVEEAEYDEEEKTVGGKLKPVPRDFRLRYITRLAHTKAPPGRCVKPESAVRCSEWVKSSCR